ncbi:cell division protein ZapC [Paraglaciecola sp. Hal342]
MKSWLYKAQNTSGAHFSACIAEASFDDNAELGQVVVLEQDDSCATCMLISEDFMISDRSASAKFEIIKVMNDRLIPFLADIPEYKRA